ncbi:MAG: DUF2283 domain-containing protein [Salinibacter sp.]|uniref:DUF2283 domain-containing protein n=1 Tax=Salinibacter sp. TaxID=2065818 RepID=UPI0035D4D644
MDKDTTVWYGRKGDYLEVLFRQKEGYFRETENDAAIEKVDPEGHVIGCSLLNARQNPSEASASAPLRDAAP